MTESKIPISTCRPQGATLRKVRSLKHTKIRPLDDISYVIKRKNGNVRQAGLLQSQTYIRFAPFAVHST